LLLSNSSLVKIVSLWLKEQLFYLFYIFLQFVGKEYDARLNPWPGAGAGTAWEKIRSRSQSRLKKKSGAGAAKKLSGSQP